MELEYRNQEIYNGIICKYDNGILKERKKYKNGNYFGTILVNRLIENTYTNEGYLLEKELEERYREDEKYFDELLENSIVGYKIYGNIFIDSNGKESLLEETKRIALYSYEFEE